MEFDYPQHKKLRVIINTDTKAEADDQYAIVHGILTPSFELHGIIAAHFGDKISQTSMLDSRGEIDLLLRLMGLEGSIRAENGAPHPMPDELTPVDSAGARLIIEEALKDDDRTLNIAFCGPLTDMASALLLEPAIEGRNIRVIWIGGYTWPAGGREYNLANDIHAASVVFKSRLEVWQVPYNAYRMMPVSHSELIEKVYPHGRIGAYLVEQLLEYNSRKKEAIEYRSLGDSPVIGLIMYPEGGRSEWRPAPEIDPQMHYIHNGRHRAIKVYETVDPRFILEDFFAKIARFARSSNED
ncbi:nucleoside hydrolase [Paenibacillus sp. WQ 127069]|uniref:Nucleoside hydrolase n=1 Tax=Paenibacillus baimaensis TaxID=2982185 RepID=A0ABT2UKC9_9BACL|nr:nucleoside hydrolase [Paenibacillus sp. WQ 127069]MCU6794124.1 nucleoside hydrolase [Paenibacillus sp. WQ 127069]